MKTMVVSAYRALAPRSFARRQLRKLSGKFAEPELRLLPCLCDPRKISLDIGAYDGLFIAHMLGLSLKCVAFEPRPDAAAGLRKMLAVVPDQASVEAVALSNRNGETKMRTVANAPGLSTIERDNTLASQDGGNQIVEVAVRVRTLDDYAFENVGFIKIDVEGHELAALQGGRETIIRSHPALLIEAEDRHRAGAVAGVADFLKGLGYCGFFLVDGVLNPVEKYQTALHQNVENVGDAKNGWAPRGIYINNFIFVPADRVREFTGAVASLTGKKQTY